MATSAAAAIALPGLLTIATVGTPLSRAASSAASTYGVRPDAAIPTTRSSGPGASASRSERPRSARSSAPSTAVALAWPPPASTATTRSGSVP